MPKPLLLARRSGLYARFFIPSDLQGHVGSRYLVRPLYAPAGDGARLVAARLGPALSQAFDAMRKGIAVDLEQLLKRERIRRKIYLTRETARSDVFDYIEMFYNPKRRDGSNGGVSPLEFERQAGFSGL
jgi:transposase InsO family protein